MAQMTHLKSLLVDYAVDIEDGRPYAIPNAKHDIIPILSVVRVCKDQIVFIGSAMMTRSPRALVAIKDWIIGM